MEGLEVATEAGVILEVAIGIAIMAIWMYGGYRGSDCNNNRRILGRYVDLEWRILIKMDAGLTYGVRE